MPDLTDGHQQPKELLLGLPGLQAQAGQNGSSFGLDGIEQVRVKLQSLQDGWRNLSDTHQG